jgi:hypothetical protein
LIPEQLRRDAADNLADYISSAGQNLNSDAIVLFLAWGGHRSEHRQVFLFLLDHASPNVRSAALTCSGYVLHLRDYPILFKFRHDPEFSESITMGGPLRYFLRDQALATLEKLINARSRRTTASRKRPQVEFITEAGLPF